jgi:antirestriction protein ArdC
MFLPFSLVLMYGRTLNRRRHAWVIFLAGWLKKLRDDRKLLILAAAQAQRAADYILGKRCGE